MLFVVPFPSLIVSITANYRLHVSYMGDILLSQASTWPLYDSGSVYTITPLWFGEPRSEDLFTPKRRATLRHRPRVAEWALALALVLVSLVSAFGSLALVRYQFNILKDDGSANSLRFEARFFAEAFFFPTRAAKAISSSPCALCCSRSYTVDTC